MFLAYVPFFESLVHLSTTDHYAGHVGFVPVFAVLLLWTDRHRLRGSIGQGEWSGGVITILAVAMLALGYDSASVPLQAVSFVIATTGLALWLYGRRSVRAAGFVLVFLLFMIPPSRGVVSAVAPAMQHFVAAVSTVVLDVLQIPVERQGTLLLLPGVALEIAEECAGLRFVLILFVCASAFGRLASLRVSRQITLAALSIPVAIMANAARVAALSAGAHLVGPQVIRGPVHYDIGRAFWVLGLLTMIAIASLLHGRPRDRIDGGGRGRRAGRREPGLLSARAGPQ